MKNIALKLIISLVTKIVKNIPIYRYLHRLQVFLKPPMFALASWLTNTHLKQTQLKTKQLNSFLIVLLPFGLLFKG